MSINDLIEACTNCNINTSLVIGLIPAIVSLISVGVASYQVYIYTKLQRSEHIRKVQDLICFDKDAAEIWYNIIGKQTKIDITKMEDSERQKLDQYLSNLNYACYLKKQGLLKDDEFRTIEYYIVITLAREEIQNYLTSDICLLTSPECAARMEYLMEYGYSHSIIKKKYTEGNPISALTKYIEKEYNKANTNLYSNYDNAKLRHSTSRKPYTGFAEIESFASENVEIKIIDTENALKEYIDQELSHKNTGGNLRFYRGHKHACWTGRSTLLREFHEIWAPLLGEAFIDCRNDPDHAEHNGFGAFKSMHKEMWSKLQSRENLHDVISGIFSVHKSKAKNVEQFDEYIESLAKRAEDVADYLKTCEEINAGRIEVAAQHYGLPTSLIDFTKSLPVALCFAIKDKPDSYGNELDPYFSILQFDPGDKVHDWEYHLGRSNMSNENLISDPEHLAMYRETCSEDDSSRLDEITCALYIDQSKWRDIDNHRINKQKGVLICLGKYDHCSIEEAFRHFPKDKIPKLTFVAINRALAPQIPTLLGNEYVPPEALGLQRITGFDY